MPPAARKRCDFPGCDRGEETPEGGSDCYITPEGLPTREKVIQDLKEHVEMAHVLPMKFLEAERDKLKAEADKLNAEAAKIRAERPADHPTVQTPRTTTSAPKTEKIPRPTVEEGVSEGDWGFFTAQWNRYVDGTGIDGITIVQQLWAACSTALQKTLHNGGAGTVTDPKILLDIIKSLAVKRQITSST